MDWSNPKQVAAFMDLHSGNPREGPGDKASTARALAAVTTAAGERQIESVLDLACGPGMQTRHLAELLPTSHITALDIHPAFLAELDGWIAQNELEHQVTTVHGDMKQPPAAWAAYYDPLQRRVDTLRTKYVNDPDGKQVINEGQQEIDAWRNYGEYFSYAFIVTRPR